MASQHSPSVHCAFEWDDARRSIEVVVPNQKIGKLEPDELPPYVLCEQLQGTSITAALTPLSPSSGCMAVSITSSARVCEMYRGSAYVGTVSASAPSGIFVIPGGGQVTLYMLEVLVGPQDSTLELRFPGIKSPGSFCVKGIEVTNAAQRVANGQVPSTSLSQQQQLAALLSLVQQRQDQAGQPLSDEHVPEDLRTLYDKASAAPDSTQAAAVQQMAATLARGVLTQPGQATGGGGAPAGLGVPLPPPAAAASAAATPTAAEDARSAAVLAAIAQSEARVLAAVDVLARRVEGLEAALLTGGAGDKRAPPG
jgi:hypothetical protein